jgi:hypothetical protein
MPWFSAQPDQLPPAQLSTGGQPDISHEEEKAVERQELKIYSHSSLFYWWPVWVVGYLMAAITYSQGQQIQIGDAVEWFHASKNLGVIFSLTAFLVILITSVSVRGLASAVVVLLVIIAILLFAYLDWWDDILAWFGSLSVHMNMGFYMMFSTLLAVAWLLAFFVFDRMSYWRIKPGQITQEFVFGAGSRSYDTDNMVLEKFRDDVFRHWVLGLGSGDLHIKTMGADRDTINVPNVLFVGRKVKIIQRMIATEPDAFGRATLK